MTDESFGDQEYEDGSTLAAESLRPPLCVDSLDWSKSSPEVTLDRDELWEVSDSEELVNPSDTAAVSESVLLSCVSKTW